MQVLEPIWKPTLISSTYQSIKGRGIHKALKDIKRDLKKYNPSYYLQIDIQKFYPSISAREAKKAVRRKIKDPKMLDLLDDIIDSCDGVPIGNFISQYLGNLVVSDIDHKCKEEYNLKMYYRYCDDIVVFANSVEELEKFLSKAFVEFGSKGLSIKRNYVLRPVDKGLDFVGYRVFPNKVLLRERIKNSYRKAKYKTLPSYNGWLTHCNCHNLRKKYEDNIKCKT